MVAVATMAESERHIWDEYSKVLVLRLVIVEGERNRSKVIFNVLFPKCL